jgi:hypothetical protein
MTHELVNLVLFAALLAKVAVYCGFAEFAAVYGIRSLARRRGRPHEAEPRPMAGSYPAVRLSFFLSSAPVSSGRAVSPEGSI